MRSLKPVSDRLDNTMWKGLTDHGKAVYIEKRHTGTAGWRFFIYVKNRPFGNEKGYTTIEDATRNAYAADAI